MPVKILTVGNPDDTEYVRAEYESAAAEAWQAENPDAIENALIYLDLLNDQQLSDAAWQEKHINGPRRVWEALQFPTLPPECT